jgi:3-deoxy-7-phosphoheptulonate synthase
MIIQLKNTVTAARTSELAAVLQAITVVQDGATLLVTPSATKTIDPSYEGDVDKMFVMETDIQLANPSYMSGKRTVQWGKNTIGGTSNNSVVIAGPCSVESREQIMQSAQLMNSLGISTLRGGCYKPRTSPYTFQGLGLEGLKLLAEAGHKYNLSVITEVKDSSHIDEVIEHTNIIQVGAKAMYDHSILKRCGKANKPVLLKRGFGTTLQEFVQSAEFILSGGNDQVILCERGIRTFETKTRFTLDLCGAAYLKHHTNLPVILDPSHAIGYAYAVPDLSRACIAMGIEGVLIEVHPTPKTAKSDASQQLNHQEFTELFGTLTSIAKAVGRNII